MPAGPDDTLILNDGEAAGVPSEVEGNRDGALGHGGSDDDAVSTKA